MSDLTDLQGSLPVKITGATLTGVETNAVNSSVIGELWVTDADTHTNIGPTTEAAAATDTSTSGLNGLIKRLLQKFTTQFPAALTGGRFDVNLGSWFGSTAPTVGQKTMANSIPVTLASDQSVLSIKDITTGTWANGVETAVAGTAVQVQAVNANRRKLIVQNTGPGNVRIGITGVTATTGMRLLPSGHLIIEEPFIETAAIFAIREGTVSSIVLTQETT